MIRNLHLLILSLLTMVAMGQYSPLWQATPYIEAVSYTVINNNHMAVSPFTLAVTFTSIFTTPKLAICIIFITQLSHRYDSPQAMSWHSASTRLP